MSKYRIAIDFDDTLADYMGLYRLAASFYDFKEIRPENIDSWEWPKQYGHDRFVWFTKFVHTKDNILYLRPHEEKDIRWIYEHFLNLGEIFIISHQYSPEAQEAIELWCETYLQSYLSENTFNVVVVSSREEKVKKALELGCNVIIEDNVETCKEAVEAGMTAILIKRPWIKQPPMMADYNKLIIADSLYNALKKLYIRWIDD